MMCSCMRTRALARKANPSQGGGAKPRAPKAGGSRATERTTIVKKTKSSVDAIVFSYERLLELPVVVVLAVLWLAGAALLGTCALSAYLYGSLLVQMLAGS